MSNVTSASSLARYERMGIAGSMPGACLTGLPYGPMRLFVMFLVVLLLIGGGMKLAGAQIPILDYPFGGPMGQPQIEVVQPDLNLP